MSRGSTKIFRLHTDGAPERDAIDVMDTTAGSDEIAMAALMTEAVCPTAEDIQQWHAAVEVSIGQPLGNHVCCVYLTWSNGRIDCDQSQIRVGDFCQPTGTLSIHTGLQPLYNVIFRTEMPAESARA